MKVVDVYADGSGTLATMAGGFGWVLVVDGVKVADGSGHIEKATNNDSELHAAIEGLAAAFRFINKPPNVLGELEPVEIVPPEVTLVSDSQIILGWANGNRFKQKDKIHKYNQLRALMKRLNAKTRWVRGHSGDEHNERCDELANFGRTGEWKKKRTSKKKEVKDRAFKWNDQREAIVYNYETNLGKKGLLSDKEVVSDSNNFSIEALTRIVLELVELQEKKKV